MKSNHYDVWVIVSDNIPVEVYQDELTAQQIALDWSKQSQTSIICYRVPMISQ